PKQVLLAMGARLAENGAFYIYSVFALVYATQVVHMDRSIVLYGILIASALELPMIPFFGALSDRVGRKPVYFFGGIPTRAPARGFAPRDFSLHLFARRDVRATGGFPLRAVWHESAVQRSISRRATVLRAGRRAVADHRHGSSDLRLRSRRAGALPDWDGNYHHHLGHHRDGNAAARYRGRMN